MPDDFKFDVFISYTEKDKKEVTKLAKRLKRRHFRVWLDQWEVGPGEMIGLKIERGLQQSRTLLLIMSANAFSSDWVTTEFQTAFSRDPTNQQRRFIPILLTDCHIPDLLRNYRYIDFRQKSEVAFTELVETLDKSANSPLPQQHPGEVSKATINEKSINKSRPATFFIGSSTIIFCLLVFVLAMRPTSTSLDIAPLEYPEQKVKPPPVPGLSVSDRISDDKTKGNAPRESRHEDRTPQAKDTNGNVEIQSIRPSKSVVIVDSARRKNRITEILGILRNSKLPDNFRLNLSTKEISDEMNTTEVLAEQKPDLVIIHLNAFDEKDDKRLLAYLKAINTASPDTRFLVYSAGFVKGGGQYWHQKIKGENLEYPWGYQGGERAPEYIVNIDTIEFPNTGTNTASFADTFRAKVRSILL